MTENNQSAPQPHIQPLPRDKGRATGYIVAPGRGVVVGVGSGHYCYRDSKNPLQVKRPDPYVDFVMDYGPPLQMLIISNIDSETKTENGRLVADGEGKV